MKLYHSSNMEVRNVDTLHSRDFLDFGKGFYLTTILEQAVKYAERFSRRHQEAWLNVYEFNFDPVVWRVMSFESYDKDWLRFVAKCRSGNDDTDFDLVVGGIANDKVIRTLDRYFNGEITEEQALGMLVYERPNIQYCIRSQQMLDECLIHVKSKKL